MPDNENIPQEVRDLLAKIDVGEVQATALPEGVTMDDVMRSGRIVVFRGMTGGIKSTFALAEEKSDTDA